MLLLCRFRPICVAEVMNEPVKSSVVSGLDQGRTDNNVTRATVQPSVIASRRSSRTVLFPSPSSAFSPPNARKTDPVEPTVRRNTDLDVPAQRHGTPDVEYRYRRRRTVKEMAQSYDRATQSEVLARRQSYTFRTTLPTATAAVNPASSSAAKAMTAETTRDHYTTTSVFSLSRSKPQSEKADETKPHETKLKRLYSNTIASLYKSLDNFARLQGPFAADRNKRNEQESAAESPELDLRRSASSHHITEIYRPADRGATFRNNKDSGSVATFPLSSRHHSHSIHTLTNITNQNFCNLVKPEMEIDRDDLSDSGAESKDNGKHNYSRWKIAPSATNDLNLDRSMETDKNTRLSSEASMETKTAEMKVVLDRKFTTEPVTTSRSLTVRQSPSLSVPSSSTSLSMAFVSPRPIRKVLHHLEPLSPPSLARARSTSVAALEKFEDAQQLLMKSADLPSTSTSGDGQSLKSSSPCKTLIELVRKSHLSAFPSSSLAPSSSIRSSSNTWMTSAELGNTGATLAGLNDRERTRGSQDQQQSGLRHDYSREDRNNSTSSVKSDFVPNNRNQVVQSTSPGLPGLQFRERSSVRTVLSVPPPFTASAPRFSPSVQPQRAAVGVIPPRVTSRPVSLLVTTTTSTHPSLAHPYQSSHQQVQHSYHHHHNLLQAPSQVTAHTHLGQKETSLQNLSTIPPLSSSSSAAAVRPSELTTTLSSSKLHPSVTSPAAQVRSISQLELGQSGTQVYDESLLSNDHVTAALDSAIELLQTLTHPPTDLTLTQGQEIKASWNKSPAINNDMTQADIAEFGYDLLDEEPTPIPREKPQSQGGKSPPGEDQTVQVLSTKKDGSRTVKDELDTIQRRRAFQLQCKDDSFDQAATPSDCPDITWPPGESHRTNTAKTALPLPRDSVIARYRRRCAARHGLMTSSSSSSRDDPVTSSSSSSLSTDSSSETQQSPPIIARRTLRRHKRLRDPA